MPYGNGGSLAAEGYNDLVALILKSNGLPAGSSELSPATIPGVQIIPKDGPGELPANSSSAWSAAWRKAAATGRSPARRHRSEREDADRTGRRHLPLGTGTVTLKFVLTNLNQFAGQRMSVAGMLIGAGGVTSTSRL